jgi:hypothetical protein
MARVSKEENPSQSKPSVRKGRRRNEHQMRLKPSHVRSTRIRSSANAREAVMVRNISNSQMSRKKRLSKSRRRKM